VANDTATQADQTVWTTNHRRPPRPNWHGESEYCTYILLLEMLQHEVGYREVRLRKS